MDAEAIDNFATDVFNERLELWDALSAPSVAGDFREVFREMAMLSDLYKSDKLAYLVAMAAMGPVGDGFAPTVYTDQEVADLIGCGVTADDVSGVIQELMDTYVTNIVNFGGVTVTASYPVIPPLSVVEVWDTDGRKRFYLSASRGQANESVIAVVQQAIRAVKDGEGE